MKKFPGLLLLTLSVFCASTVAQIAAYTEGESLTYEAKISKVIFRGLSVADLNFTVSRSPESRDYLVKAEARSKGTLTKLLNFKFYQRIQSTVDDENLFVKRTVKRDEQGDDRIRDSEALFDYKEKKVIYIETDPNDTAKAPRQIASPIEDDTQDLITGIYTLRRLPLAVGKTFELKISDSGLVYKIPVRVTAREQQKTILGRVWCFRIEPQVFGANRIIDNDGSMILWITDDVRRMPVRAQINVDIGKIEVKLKKIEIQ